MMLVIVSAAYEYKRLTICLSAVRVGQVPLKKSVRPDSHIDKKSAKFAGNVWIHFLLVITMIDSSDKS